MLSGKDPEFRHHLSRLVAGSESEKSSFVAVVSSGLAVRILVALCLGWFYSSRGLQESVKLVAVAVLDDTPVRIAAGAVVLAIEVATTAHDEHDYHPAKCQ